MAAVLALRRVDPELRMLEGQRDESRTALRESTVTPPGHRLSVYPKPVGHSPHRPPPIEEPEQPFTRLRLCVVHARPFGALHFPLLPASSSKRRCSG